MIWIVELWYQERMKTLNRRVPPLERPSPRVLRKVQALATEHEGEIAAIEPRTGEFFIGDGVLEAIRKGRRKHPRGVFYLVRIGYEAVDFQSGGLSRA